MAINVMYQVPNSLIQQQRQAENRAYRRQMNLLQMQQNFQREQTEANRQFQRETMQTAYQHQADKLADERQYQQQKQAHKEQREDSIRQEALQLAQKKQQEAQIQQAETAAWQDSERQRQALEKQFNYSEAQLMELKQLANDERDAYQQYSQGAITPEQYRQALGMLRARRMGIMPETPKNTEETMSMAERFKSEIVTDANGDRYYKDNQGNWKCLTPPMDSVSAKLQIARGDALTKAIEASKDKEGNFDEKRFEQFENIIDRIYPEKQNTKSNGPQLDVPQTAGGYIQNAINGGSPMAQMMNQQQQQPQEQPQQPMQEAEAQDLQAMLNEEAQEDKGTKIHYSLAPRLRRLKERNTEIDRRFKREGDQMFAPTRKELEAERKQNDEEISKLSRGEYNPKTQEQPKEQTKPAAEPVKPTEQPKPQAKQEAPKKTTSVTFNGISDINGLKAWVSGKRYAVGDKLPNGGKITDLDFDNGTLTYELDGKKYTIRKSRNAQEI